MMPHTWCTKKVEGHHRQLRVCVAMIPPPSKRITNPFNRQSKIFIELVDRLVQPLPYETLIFSHFTHFTLRPNSDPTPIRLRVHHSNSDITPTVPRHSPSHTAFHRRSPRST